ncbi:MAG: hypothetical protein N3J91_11140 [Verrucomicrobiae bacterium]|nr:hypothetical protein [Verrucomicrobiae bacterium]
MNTEIYNSNDVVIMPASFYAAVGLLVILTLEALRKWRRLTGMFSLVAYFTVFLWYIVDVRYSAEQYAGMPTEDIEMAFWQVSIFLISFRLFIQIARTHDREVAGITADQISAQLPARKMAGAIAGIWAMLFVWGVIRMDGDILGALFPVGGRWSPHMWARGALGGTWDWLIAAGGYLYIFVCGLMGLLAVLVRDRVVRGQMLLLIVITWPYFFLLGTRNQLLAVVCPGLFSYLLLSRAKMWKKILGGGIVLVVLNYAMLAMLQFRHSGFQAFLKDPFGALNPEVKHEGLNMIQELAYINGFYRMGQLKPEYGKEYIAQALNAIPRAIWPGKPTLSFAYSTLRGHGTAEGGVTATISTGLIGQGAINFGDYLGPIAAGLLLALYGYFLIRQWPPKSHPLRFFLFIMGLALVPNMGREFTLLVLWPVVFGAITLRIFEHLIPAHFQPVQRVIEHGGKSLSRYKNNVATLGR